MKPYTRKDRRGYRNLAASAVAAGIMLLGSAGASGSAQATRAASAGSTSGPLLPSAVRPQDDTCGQCLGELLKDVV